MSFLDRLDRRLPGVGYWLRPYDMLADRRRWWWQERHPCQHSDGLLAVLRWWEEEHGDCPVCDGTGDVRRTIPDRWLGSGTYTYRKDCGRCGGTGRIKGRRR